MQVAKFQLPPTLELKGSSSMYYLYVYNNLCSSRSQLKQYWLPGSGLHRHHILPRHAGGDDSEENFTYLTLREHTIAHFLLWKIYKNPNDLRSMHMLGAELTPLQRKITGEWCRDNNIGFFKYSKEKRRAWALRGLETQRLSGDTDSFYFWSTEEGRKKRASMGGKIGGVKQSKDRIGIHSAEMRAIATSLGGKAIKGMICVTNGTHRTRIRPEHLDDYVANGYVKGFKISS